MQHDRAAVHEAFSEEGFVEMRRYWKVISTDAISELQKIDKARKKARKALMDFGKEIGATETGTGNGLFQSVVSVVFKFDVPPDSKIWKRIDSEWWAPKASAKELKAACRILAYAYPSTEAVAKSIGVDAWFDTERFSLCSPIFVGCKKSWYFSTTNKEFNGNEHVERIADVDIERVFK